MNKYEEHYQSGQTSDLLRKFPEHKLQTQPLGKERGEALVAVFHNHNLQGKYREVFTTHSLFVISGITGIPANFTFPGLTFSAGSIVQEACAVKINELRYTSPMKNYICH